MLLSALVKTKHAGLIFTNCQQFGLLGIFFNQTWQSKQNQSVLIVSRGSTLSSALKYLIYFISLEKEQKEARLSSFFIFVSSSWIPIQRPSDRDVLRCVGLPSPPLQNPRKCGFIPLTRRRAPTQPEWAATLSQSRCMESPARLHLHLCQNTDSCSMFRHCTHEEHGEVTEVWCLSDHHSVDGDAARGLRDTAEEAWLVFKAVMHSRTHCTVPTRCHFMMLLVNNNDMMMDD